MRKSKKNTRTTSATISVPETLRVSNGLLCHADHGVVKGEWIVIRATKGGNGKSMGFKFDARVPEGHAAAFKKFCDLADNGYAVVVRYKFTTDFEKYDYEDLCSLKASKKERVIAVGDKAPKPETPKTAAVPAKQEKPKAEPKAEVLGTLRVPKECLNKAKQPVPAKQEQPKADVMAELLKAIQANNEILAKLVEAIK